MKKIVVNADEIKKKVQVQVAFKRKNGTIPLSLNKDISFLTTVDPVKLMDMEENMEKATPPGVIAVIVGSREVMTPEGPAPIHTIISFLDDGKFIMVDNHIHNRTMRIDHKTGEVEFLSSTHVGTEGTWATIESYSQTPQTPEEQKVTEDQMIGAVTLARQLKLISSAEEEAFCSLLNTDIGYFNVFINTLVNKSGSKVKSLSFLNENAEPVAEIFFSCYIEIVRAGVKSIDDITKIARDILNEELPDDGPAQAIFVKSDRFYELLAEKLGVKYTSAEELETI